MHFFPSPCKGEDQGEGPCTAHVLLRTVQDSAPILNCIWRLTTGFKHKTPKLRMPQRPQHGFTSVDQQPDPNAWIDVLDKLRAEPFYAAYKQRVLERLEPRDGARYLDLGAGTGDDARSLASSANCCVIAADYSLTMAMECRARGRVPSLVCDAAHLPFPEATFDGTYADRTFQHLLNPESALDEIIRVSRTAGRVVVVDPDYDNQVMEFPDQNLARRVLRYRADRMLRNGTIAHRMPAMFRDAGLRLVQVEPLTLTVRDPTAIDNVMGLRTWARSAAANGFLSAADADLWERLFDETVQSGKFLYALTFFITSGVR
jgi:ubiquinone/menaquinone biosynthesis C-methylase UbiE